MITTGILVGRGKFYPYIGRLVQVKENRGRMMDKDSYIKMMLPYAQDAAPGLYPCKCYFNQWAYETAWGLIRVVNIIIMVV